jgi:hypothetical protein
LLGQLSDLLLHLPQGLFSTAVVRLEPMVDALQLFQGPLALLSHSTPDPALLLDLGEGLLILLVRSWPFRPFRHDQPPVRDGTF